MEWENHKESKLLAQPFNSSRQNLNTHEAIKELIFTAALEITKSVSIEVSNPLPSLEALRARCYPLVFLIYNLTDDQAQLMLE